MKRFIRRTSNIVKSLILFPGLIFGCGAVRAGYAVMLLILVLWMGGSDQLLAQQQRKPQPVGVPVTGQAARQASPQAPFRLNQGEQKGLDDILLAWQNSSGTIKTFECDFIRWEYQPVLGPRNKSQQLVATTIAKGQIKYMKPDKGLFQVKETLYWNADTQKHVADPNTPGEHWVCDGQNVYEVNKLNKAVFQMAIPPHMQGKHISEGPLPFLLFGAEAVKLKARYFMRENTDPRYAKDEVWLESYPRWRGDAANFKMSQLIMKRKNFLPYALRLYSPNGKDYSVFEFKNVKINNFFFRKGSLGQPKIPKGYKLIRRGPVATALNPPSSSANRNRNRDTHVRDRR